MAAPYLTDFAQQRSDVKRAFGSPYYLLNLICMVCPVDGCKSATSFHKGIAVSVLNLTNFKSHLHAIHGGSLVGKVLLERLTHCGDASIDLDNLEVTEEVAVTKKKKPKKKAKQSSAYERRVVKCTLANIQDQVRPPPDHSTHPQFFNFSLPDDEETEQGRTVE